MAGEQRRYGPRLFRIDFLAGRNGDKILRITRGSSRSRGRPFYQVAFLLAFGKERLFSLDNRCTLMGIGGDKCRGPVIVFLKAVGDALGVP